MPITVFTWGYYGWGNHTPRLVEAVDAVETSRGFEPPIFVDIRIRRSVRAIGFTGAAFEKLVGPSRHRWMKSLGNKFILSRSGPKIQIAEPAAADDLLDLAVECARHERRLVFFCSCQWPKCDGETNCHRSTVAGLVLKAANRLGVAVELVEWPGGNPKPIDADLTPKGFAAVRNNRKTVPLDKHVDLAEVAGIPWCSIATLHAGGKELHRVVGPAIYKSDGWALPVLYGVDDPAMALSKYQLEAAKLRSGWGLEQRTSG